MTGEPRLHLLTQQAPEFLDGQAGILEDGLQRLALEDPPGVDRKARAADAMEERFGRDVFPDGPGRAQAFVTDVRKALAEAK